MKITAKPNPDRPGFRCTFKDPRTRKATCHGLATRDAEEAQAVCDDIAAIFDDPTLVSDPTSPLLKAFHPRAVEIVHKIEIKAAPAPSESQSRVLTELRRQMRATDDLIAMLNDQKQRLQRMISKIEGRA